MNIKFIIKELSKWYNLKIIDQILRIEEIIKLLNITFKTTPWDSNRIKVAKMKDNKNTTDSTSEIFLRV